MEKSYEEINEKIKKRQAVVVTADQIADMVDRQGFDKTAQTVDVVTTGTFGPMCSSGAFINFGHTKPRIRAEKVWLNDVEAYAGIAAVDIYIGATQLKDQQIVEGQQPDMRYGGGHVIEDLVAGKPVTLRALSYGTDCYPAKKIMKKITLTECGDAFIFNPRNAYQSYNCAVNLSDRTIYTYMGVLKPHLGNATFCSAGQLSPLLNDPLFLTIGIGTRIFLGGGIGYVTGPGTQHHPTVPRGENGVPFGPAGTVAVTGDMKKMSSNWLKGTMFKGYGATLRVGVGFPIPILNEGILRYTIVREEDMYTKIVDYSHDYPQMTGKTLGEVSYAELRSGRMKFQDKEIPTASFSPYKKALQIAHILKEWIEKGEFFLGKPVELLPNGLEPKYI